MIEAKVSKFGPGQTWLMHARLFSAPLKPTADRLRENVFKKKNRDWLQCFNFCDDGLVEVSLSFFFLQKILKKFCFFRLRTIIERWVFSKGSNALTYIEYTRKI